MLMPLLLSTVMQLKLHSLGNINAKKDSTVLR
jgi:hypothetical protein